MALDFPSSPFLDQVYTSGLYSWKWNGSSWLAVSYSTGTSGTAGSAELRKLIELK